MTHGDVPHVARTMLRHYGDRAAELMQDRSRNCRRHGDPGSAAFWERVRLEVCRISGAGADPHENRIPHEGVIG
jgi:hypothetical protein